MEEMSHFYLPRQAIQATERLGFYETAEAMKQIAGAFRTETPKMNFRSKGPTTAARIRFSRFRHKFQPFA